MGRCLKLARRALTTCFTLHVRRVSEQSLLEEQEPRNAWHGVLEDHTRSRSQEPYLDIEAPAHLPTVTSQHSQPKRHRSRRRSGPGTDNTGGDAWSENTQTPVGNWASDATAVHGTGAATRHPSGARARRNRTTRTHGHGAGLQRPASAASRSSRSSVSSAVSG